MSELLLITRVQDVKVLETTVKELQARLDEITTKRDGTKKCVSDGDTRMKRGGLCQRS